MPTTVKFQRGAASLRYSNRFGCGYGSELRNRPSKMLKIAVLAAIPRANIAITARLNPGFRASARMAALIWLIGS
jgi:hypothetical protein